MATEYYSLEKLGQDLHQGITPIKVVDDEPESSEAEAANRTVDARDPDFQEAEVSEKKEKDRLNINKGVPQSTTWERENKKEEKKEEPKEQEPKYPFNDAQPVFAYYGNDKRTLLFFILRHPDGPQGQPGPTDTHQIHNTPDHKAAWHWVHKLVGADAINKNTNDEIDRINKQRKQEEVADKDRKHKMNQEDLFQAKIAAFEMDLVRNTTRRDLKSKIRRAKSIMELTAYVGAIVALETYKNDVASANNESGTN